MRVTRGKIKKRKHKRVLKAASGYAHAKSHRYRVAKNQVEKSLQYSTIDRKRKKREMRKMWITRINIVCRLNNVSYSRFISGLKKSKIILNRQILNDLALNDIEALKEIISLATASS